jgi:hypothetical protein
MVEAGGDMTGRTAAIALDDDRPGRVCMVEIIRLRVSDIRRTRRFRVLAVVCAVVVVAGCTPKDGPSAGAPEPGPSAPVGDLERALDARLAACTSSDQQCRVDAVDLFLDECLALRGFVRVRLPSGIFEIHSGGQPEALAEAFDECVHRAYAALPPVPSADADYYAHYYDFLLELKACVETAGYEVPEPPSRDSFVESEGANWHPYQNMDRLGDAALAALERTCPQDPSWSTDP